MEDITGVSSSNKPAELLFSKDINGYFLTKRFLDISLAVVLLIFFSPLMLILAIMIKIDSPGPVFFKQERIGSRRVLKNGIWIWEAVEFQCLKFRTMVHHADPGLHRAYVTALIKNNSKKMDEIQNGQQPVRKLVHDPRITRIGRTLRKFSLDELPQFINVLFGEMSLVGPRPAIRYEVDSYKPWHRRRLNAQPGITGLQQVKARCTADFDDQVKYDLEYIEKQSLWLDIKIMVMTPILVLKHRGAY